MVFKKPKITSIGKAVSIKVKFLVSCGEGKFKAGEVVEMNMASANHWIKRGKAIKYVKSASKKKKAKAQKATEPQEKKEMEAPDQNQGEMQELIREPPITVTDPTPEIEKDPI